MLDIMMAQMGIDVDAIKRAAVELPQEVKKAVAAMEQMQADIASIKKALGIVDVVQGVTLTGPEIDTLLGDTDNDGDEHRRSA